MGTDFNIRFIYDAARCKDKTIYPHESEAWSAKDEIQESENECEKCSPTNPHTAHMEFSIGLGSGCAWSVFMRLFAIAAYRQTTNTETRKTLLQLIPPQTISSKLVDVDLLKTLCLAPPREQKEGVDNIYWLYSMYTMSTYNAEGSTKKSCGSFENLIQKLQTLVPFLATKEDDLDDTPYSLSKYEFLADDERPVQLVHYMTKGLRYKAIFKMGD
jgi:hypothetical protein